MHCLNALSQSEKNDQNKVADLENMNSVSFEAWKANMFTSILKERHTHAIQETTCGKG